MPESKKKIKWFPYLVAWITYAGGFLTRLGNLGNVIRDNFSDIHPPQKNEYAE